MVHLYVRKSDRKTTLQHAPKTITCEYDLACVGHAAVKLLCAVA